MCLPPHGGAASTRASYPISDIGRFLLGAWQVTRLGWDGVPARTMRPRTMRPRTMRLWGTARFSPCAAGLLFEERGMMAVGAYLGEAVRRYVFHVESASVARVCFEDGSPFHRLDLETGLAHVQHDCTPDRYEGRYRVLATTCWQLSWRVTGPRKNQVITSRFSRAEAG